MDNVIQHLWSTILHYPQPFKHSLTIPLTYSQFIIQNQNASVDISMTKINDSKSESKSQKQVTESNHQFYTSLLQKIRTQLEKRIINVSKIKQLGSKLYNRLTYDIGLLSQNQKKLGQLQHSLVVIQNCEDKFEQTIYQLMRNYCASRASRQSTDNNQDIEQDNVDSFMQFLRHYYVNFTNRMDKQILKLLSDAMESCRVQIPSNLPQASPSLSINYFTQSSSVELCSKLLQILKKLRTLVYTQYQNLISPSTSGIKTFHSFASTVKQEESQSALLFLSKLRTFFVDMDEAFCDEDCSLNKLYWYAQEQWKKVIQKVKKIYVKYVRDDIQRIRDWYDKQNNIFQYNKYMKKDEQIADPDVQQSEQDEEKQKKIEKIEKYSKELQKQKYIYTMRSIYYHCQVQVLKYLYMQTYIKSEIAQSPGKVTKSLNNLTIAMLPENLSSSLGQISMQSILSSTSNQRKLLSEHVRTINSPQIYFFREIEQCCYFYTIKLQQQIDQYEDLQLFLLHYAANYDILVKRMKEIKRKIQERYKLKQSGRRSSANTKVDPQQSYREELELQLQMCRMLDMLALMKRMAIKMKIFQSIDLVRQIDYKIGEIKKLRIQCMSAYFSGENRLTSLHIPFKNTNQPLNESNKKSRIKLQNSPHAEIISIEEDPSSESEEDFKMKTLQQVSKYNDEVWQFYEAEFKDLIGSGLEFAIYQLQRRNDQNNNNSNKNNFHEFKLAKIRTFVGKFNQRGRFEQKLFENAIKKAKLQQSQLKQKEKHKKELKPSNTKKLLDKYILQHIQQESLQNQSPKLSPIQLKKRLETALINLQITTKMIDINFSPTSSFVSIFHSKFPLSIIELVEEATNFQYQDWARRIKIFQDELKIYEVKCKNIGVLHTNRMTSLLSFVYKILKQYTTVIQIACDIFFQILYIFKNTKLLQKDRKGNPSTKPIDLFSDQDLTFVKQILSYKIKMKQEIQQIEKFNNLSKSARNYLKSIFVRFRDSYENYLPYSEDLLTNLITKIEISIGFRENHKQIFQVFENVLEKVQNNKGGLKQILQICRQIQEVQIQNRQIIRLGETGLPIENSCIEELKKIFSFYRDEFKIADFVCSINQNFKNKTQLKFMNHKKQVLYNKILELYKAQNY